jgi:hypothetical protein
MGRSFGVEWVLPAWRKIARVSGLPNHLNQQKKEQAHCDLARRRSKKYEQHLLRAVLFQGARENQSIKRQKRAIIAEVCNYHFRIFIP